MNSEQKTPLAQLWQRLAKVSEFSFTASNGPGSQTDWRGHASGTLEVERADDQLLFRERAQFTQADGREIALQNSFRWTLLADALRLEHMRRAKPVLLFELVPVTAHGFRARAAHQCAADNYTAELLLRKSQIELIWQIHGPRKNERLHYHYW